MSKSNVSMMLCKSFTLYFKTTYTSYPAAALQTKEITACFIRGKLRWTDTFTPLGGGGAEMKRTQFMDWGEKHWKVIIYRLVRYSTPPDETTGDTASLLPTGSIKPSRRVRCMFPCTRVVVGAEPNKSWLLSIKKNKNTRPNQFSFLPPATGRQRRTERQLAYSFKQTVYLFIYSSSVAWC